MSELYKLLATYIVGILTSFLVFFNSVNWGAVGNMGMYLLIILFLMGLLASLISGAFAYRVIRSGLDWLEHRKNNKAKAADAVEIVLTALPNGMLALFVIANFIYFLIVVALLAMPPNPGPESSLLLLAHIDTVAGLLLANLFPYFFFGALILTALLSIRMVGKIYKSRRDKETCTTYLQYLGILLMEAVAIVLFGTLLITYDNFFESVPITESHQAHAMVVGP